MSVALPSLPQGNSLGAISSLELTVTGEDAGNNLFREKVAVVNLQGRDCTYESRLRIQPGSSLMVEIPPARTGEQTWRAAAIVETVSAMGQDLFHVSIVLGRAYESAVLARATPVPNPLAANPIPEKLEPKSAPALAPPAPAAPRGATAAHVAPVWPQPKNPETKPPDGLPVSESQMRELKIAVASKTQETPQGPLSVKSTQSAPTPAKFATPPPVREAPNTDTERVIATLRPMIAHMVRDAVSSESERQMRELRESLAQEIKRAGQASTAELARYAKALPAANEQIILRAVEEATGQQVVRTTALLQPAVAEMVREAVGVESERQTRELKIMLSREVENAVQEPLAVMAQYAQTIPAIDEETVRRIVGQTAELQFERATAALQPLITEILRRSIAAEYERQTLDLKSQIFTEVGKAIQGPVALQMAAMLDSALATRMAQSQENHEQQTASMLSANGEETIPELMRKLQAMLDSLGGTMRCVLEPKPAGSNTDANAAAAAPELPASLYNNF